MSTTSDKDDRGRAALKPSPGANIVAALERAYRKIERGRCRGVIDAAGTDASVHIRIIDPAFALLTVSQREKLIMGALKEQLFDAEEADNIVSLHLVAPNEPLFAIVDRFDDCDYSCAGAMAARGKEYYAWRANSFDAMSTAATGRLMLVFLNLWLLIRDLCYCAAIVVRKFWP